MKKINESSGAHFYKCDFQVHSPRDEHWSGARAVSEDERVKYAREFIDACRERELDAIAVSDHHDLEFIDYIRDAAFSETDKDGNELAENQKIVVFPAIELTLSVPCQAILIFDSYLNSEEFPKIYQALGIEQNAKEAEKNIHPVIAANFARLDDVITKLNEVRSLRGRFILLPNISKGGQHTLVRNGFKDKYKEMSCVGGYADGKYDKLTRDEGHFKKINGEDPEWGNKKIGIFCTSDSRSRDFSKLGEAHTWVKWTEPTAEALRQACLAQESRISQEEPSLPNIYISRIVVSNSKFMGPVDLNVNPQYNAIIGGRGTGKSTILEYLRWALADQFIEDEEENYQKRRRKLIENTLLNFDGHVSVEFYKNGVMHTLKRSTSSNEALIKIGEGDTFKPVTDREVRSILSVQAYSQKQLSSVGVRVDELIRLVTTPISSFLISQKETQDELNSRIKRQYSLVKQVRDLEKEINKYELEKKSLDVQLKSLRKNLKGLDKKESKVIEDYEILSSDDEIVSSYLSDLQEMRELVNETVSNIKEFREEYDLDEETFNKSILTNISKAFTEGSGKVILLVEKASEMLDESSDDFVFDDFLKQTESWEAKKEALTKRYEQVKEKASAHKNTLKQIKEAEDRKKEIVKTISGSKAKREKLGNPSIVLDELFADWVKSLEESTEKLKEECEKLKNLSCGIIDASIIPLGDVKLKIDEFKNLSKGARIQHEKIEKLFDKISRSEKPAQKWLTLILEIEELIANKKEEEKPDVSNVETMLLDSVQVTDTSKEAITDKVTLDALLEFGLTPPADRPVFNYSSIDGDTIPFEDSSAGQQATAIMNVLLSQDGPPLIIDQPEDDLDSLVIKEIVSRLWEAKKKRQVIFSSHNANIVVNGDAELVICCSYKASAGQTMGYIESKGAIDNSSVRSFITRIMEGGEDAFKLRKEKYGF